MENKEIPKLHIFTFSDQLNQMFSMSPLTLVVVICVGKDDKRMTFTVTGSYSLNAMSIL